METLGGSIAARLRHEPQEGLAGSGTSWTVPPTNALKWRHWGDSFVVFNPASGDTHFLNGLAGAILKFLEAGPATIEETLHHLEEVSGKPLDGELTDQIGRLVEQFDAVGLIEPTRP